MALSVGMVHRFLRQSVSSRCFSYYDSQSGVHVVRNNAFYLYDLATNTSVNVSSNSKRYFERVPSWADKHMVDDLSDGKNRPDGIALDVDVASFSFEEHSVFEFL